MKKILVCLVVLLSYVAIHASDELYGPVVVYKAAAISQTSTIATTTIWTPVADGFYSVRGYEDQTAGTCSLGGQVTSTSPDGVAIQVTGFLTASGDSPRSFYVGAGNAIHFQLSASGAGCVYSYAVELIKE